MLKINFNPFPVLETTRLQLRPITLNDAHEMNVLRSDKRVLKYLDRPKESLEETRYFIQKIANALVHNQSIMWGMALKDSPRLIGSICLFEIERENYRAEIGYVLHPDYQGKGLMQEAVSAVLRYGFDVMKLHSLVAKLNPANQASIKLIERNNFVKEGYFRENYYFNGKFLDTAVYSLIGGEK